MHVFWMIFLPMALFADSLTFSTEEEEFLFEGNLEQTIDEAVAKASQYLGERDHVVLEISPKQRQIKLWGTDMRTQGGYIGFPRRYESEILQSEQEDIHYIVTTLANKTIVSIALLKTELEEAGDRIEHVHPFNFLRTIFTNEELKVGIRNIRGKGWIWSGFTAGLKESLTTEALNDNLGDELITDFARAVSVDARKIKPFILKQNWDGLLDFLIKEVPRNESGNRFDF